MSFPQRPNGRGWIAGLTAGAVLGALTGAIVALIVLAHGSLLNLYWCRVHPARRTPHVSDVAPSIA